MSEPLERKMVFGLLAEKQISTDEAALLLDALDGVRPDGIEMDFYTNKENLGRTLGTVSTVLNNLAESMSE